MITLKNFDPTSFLDIDTSFLPKEEIENLKISLSSKIGEYILLKFSNDLTPKQIEQIGNFKNGQKLFDFIKTTMPNFENKIIEELENFKKDYQNARTS